MTTTAVQIHESLKPFIPLLINEGLPSHLVMKTGGTPGNSVALTGPIDLSLYMKQQKCDDIFHKLSNKLAKIRMSIVASSNGHPIDVKCETSGPMSAEQKKLIAELRHDIATRANAVLTTISAKINKPSVVVPVVLPPAPISTNLIREKNLAAIRDLRAMNDRLTAVAAAAGDRKAVAMGNQLGTWYDELDAKLKTRKTFSRVNTVEFGRGARAIFIGVEGDVAPTPKPSAATPRKPIMVAKATKNHTMTKMYTTPDRLFCETSSPKYKVPMKYALPKATFDSIVAVVADLGKNRKLFNAKHVIARLQKNMKADAPAESWTTKVLGMLRKQKALGRSARSYVLAEVNQTATAMSRKVWSSLQLQ